MLLTIVTRVILVRVLHDMTYIAGYGTMVTMEMYHGYLDIVPWFS